VTADRFALVPNTSAGISAALHSLPVPTAGEEVVITDHGYGAVSMGVERFAHRYGLVVRTAHVPLAAEADEAFDAILSTVGDRTTLLVVDYLTSPTARLMPVKQLCAAARERNIPTIVDAANVPMMIADAITDADADFWVGNLHKYACTPRGTAVLAAHPAVSDEVEPLINSWGSGRPFPQRFDHQATDELPGWLTAPVAWITWRLNSAAIGYVTTPRPSPAGRNGQSPRRWPRCSTSPRQPGSGCPQVPSGWSGYRHGWGRIGSVRPSYGTR
jgi:isopenicillin-N epimerase